MSENLYDLFQHAEQRQNWPLARDTFKKAMGLLERAIDAGSVAPALPATLTADARARCEWCVGFVRRDCRIMERCVKTGTRRPHKLGDGK